MKRKILFALFLGIIFLIYLPWFNFTKTLSGGDWPYLYGENINAFKVLPDTSFIWLEPYYNLTAKIGTQFLSLNWEATEKIFWFLPFIIIGIFSSLTFLNFIFKDLIDPKLRQIAVLFGSLIFVANTYILMIVGGGQMGVAMAYALAPLTLYFYLDIARLEKVSLKTLFIFSLVNIFQFMFDPRIFLMTEIAILIHLLITGLVYRGIRISLIRKLFIVNSIALIANLFWIFPNLISFREEYGRAAAELSAQFLSFATFSNSLSLLHPNWPENVFGKLSFMKPEFLFIPIISFSAIFFLPKDKKDRVSVLFFILLALISSFLAKGTNDPFPQLFNLISNLPGASLFRDPTKFYLLIALSYCVLFPLGIYGIINNILKNKFKLQILFMSVCFSYFIFLISPSILGKLNGTFSPQSVPQEYVNLKNFLYPQGEFSVLWYPSMQRFGYHSKEIIGLNANEIIPNSYNSPLDDNFKKNSSKDILKDYDVKYVILPSDTKREIFVNDRKYDERVYKKDLEFLEKITWLKKVRGEFGKIVVFEVIY